MLKFRCPYSDRLQDLVAYKYFDGDLYFQPWVGPTSSEMRLVVDHCEPNQEIPIKLYNIHRYEQQCSWWNNVARQTHIDNPYYFPKIGFIHSYDCWLEAMILERYFTKMFRFATKNNTMDCNVLNMSYR